MSDPGQSGAPLVALSLNVEQAVRERYSAASQARTESLCCPVTYDARYLAAIPQEIIERDYGCGDPSRHLRPGETVLDLGSGGGKICYIAAQVVGPEGRVLGVDMNDDMLALARRHRPAIASRLGYDNVAFHKGRIQDLALDLERFDRRLLEFPVHGVDGWLRAQETADAMRRATPMIADDSVDVVVSNCVLNLVRPEDRRSLFAEIQRVLKPGGRAVISDITSERDVPETMRRDPELWSGCISGAFTELAFLDAFLAAGFMGLEIVERQPEPWTVVQGIAFRSVTIRAFKPPAAGNSPPAGAAELGAARELLYRGPWKSVTDDSGVTLFRGERTTISAAEFARLTQEPFSASVLPLDGEPPPAQGGGPCCGPSGCC